MGADGPSVWADGAAYDRYIGRWSRSVADVFLSRLGVEPGGRWLDVGCGAGALTAEILAGASPASVDAVDPSGAFVAYARERIPDYRARFRVGDAQALEFDDGSFDAVVSGLVLNFVADPGRAALELARVTHPGGTIAAYVWDYAGEMQLMRRFWDAAAELDPAAAELDEGRRFDLAAPEPLERLLRDAGLGDVSPDAIDVETVLRDFDDYWQPFLGGQGPAGAYVRSLDASRRDALAERLRAGLPREPDGSIRLVARAWAVRGMKHEEGRSGPSSK
jgi:SAM-dependent methyltransferase